jgi:molybdopterin/thiamine biosynthesis adenylyltransferase/rhodanese-related sulfurtransferase
LHQVAAVAKVVHAPSLETTMAAAFQDYLSKAKSRVREISVHELAKALAQDQDLVLLDVREPDEHENGVIERARTLPRGFLELKVEALVPKKDARVAVCCAGGVRSALAAVSLQELGYADVVSVAGGMGAWARAGYPVEQRRGLSKELLARYSRQIILPQVGEAGQKKLADAKVLCVGAGGLGSPLAFYLAAGGIGTLGIIDNDKADLSNLQRQILHHEGVVGVPKVQSARDTLRRLNSQVKIETYETRLDSSNVMEIFKGYHVVVDGTDNFPTRYLINDACVMLGIPNVHGSIFHFDGQCTVFHHGDGPCYRCLYPEPPPAELAPSCAEAGVLGAICGVIGTLQAVETMKLILGTGDLLNGRMISFDALRMTFKELRIRRDRGCPVCGDAPTIRELIDYEQFCAVSL